LVFGYKKFDRGTSLVVPSLVEPAFHRPLQAVVLRCQNGVPGDVSLLSWPALQT